MKLNPDFILREIAGEAILVPVGGAAAASGMIVLNETGADIWKHLNENCDRGFALKKMTEEYDADEKAIAADLDAFIDDLKSKRVILD